MKLFLPMVGLALAGCAGVLTSQPTPEYLEFGAKMASMRPQPVRVESDPPGAVIEIDNEVVGRTPCTIQIPALPDGKLLGGVRVNAIPTMPGDLTQSKLLVGGYPLPYLIYFNMHLGPPAINVNVN